MEFKSKLMCGPTVIGRWKYETHEIEATSNQLNVIADYITLNGERVEMVAWPRDYSFSDTPLRAYITVSTPVQPFPVIITEDFQSHHTEGADVVFVMVRTTSENIEDIMTVTEKGLVCVNDSPKTYHIHTWTQVDPPPEAPELPLYSILLEEVI